MIYVSTNQKLQFYLGGAVTTNQLPFIATTITTADAVTATNGVSNNATAVDLCAAAAGLVRHVEIYNADTVNATVYVQYNDNTTLRIIRKATLAAGASLVYDSESGWNADSGITYHGSLSGLAADDHTQYAQKATLTTKGDVYAASGASTPVRVAVGTNGLALVADSSQTAGVKYATPFQDYVAATDEATVTFNLATGLWQKVTLGGNRTLALSNVVAGMKFVLKLTQDGTGTRTVTWFTTISWAGGSAPTLTTTINKADTFGFVATAANTFDGYVLGQAI
ncbi:MAG: hypothetical protein V1899_02985 [Planctomycetota bacterium]